MPTGQFTAADLTPTSGAPTQTGQFSAADIGTPAQPSAPWRFANSFNRAASPTTNPADILTGPAYAIQHPLDSLSLIGNAIGNAQGDLLSKAKAAWQQGDYKGAVQHAINYLIPLAGPTLDQAGEQMKSGDIAGGLGTTAGVAAPVLAGSPEGRAAVGRVGDIAAPVVKTAGNLADVASLGILKKSGKAIAEGYQGVQDAAAGPKYRLIPRSNPPVADQPQAAALGDLPTPATQPAAQTGEALGTIPSAPWRMKPQAAALGDTPAPATARQFTNKVGPMIDEGLGNPPAAKPAVTPGQPIYRRTPASATSTPAPAEGSVPTAAPASPAEGMPEGAVPVEGSKAVKSYHYDEPSQTMSVELNQGTMHRYAPVSPDQAQDFVDNPSKGRAWLQLKDAPGVGHLAANYGRGWINKVSRATGDLTPQLQESVDAAQKAKWKMKTAQ